MSTNYQYNFAIIERATNMCMEVRTSTYDQSDASDSEWLYVQTETYNEEYVFKYYNEADGNFYYDAEFTEIFNP